jgi:ribosomal protein S18 acetylase RimI-like enzyme
VSGEAVVRAATPADIRAMVGLLRDVATENRWIRTERTVDVEDRMRRLQDAIVAGATILLVAEIDRRIVGELTMRIAGQRAAFGMMVAAPVRGRGIGRRLLDAAIAAARERSIDAIDLEVYAHNDAALALYRSCGFVAAGDARVEERSDGQRWEALPMSLVLRA